jgi:hypothetical protein
VANGQEANNEGSSTYIDEHREEPIATRGEHEKRRIVTSEKRSKAQQCKQQQRDERTRLRATSGVEEARLCVFITLLYLLIYL